MTSRATQQITTALHALLPSYTSPSGDDFPRVLVQLAESLLQRSRSRAPNLRNGEEEAARVWCVAEIACNRLKGRLNLPRIQGRPPCAPKVYKRLYQYLEGALVAGEGNTSLKQQQLQDELGTSSTGSMTSTGKGAPSASIPLRTVTPLKRAAATVATLQSTPDASKRRKLVQVDSEPPATPSTAWLTDHGDQTANTDEAVCDSIKPTIRRLCTCFDVPAATPHVYVGVRTIYASKFVPSSITSTQAAGKKRAGRRKNGTHGEIAPSIGKDKTPALIITVLLAVLDRMKLFEKEAIGHGDDVQGQEQGEARHEARRKAIIELGDMKALSPKQAKTADQDIEDLEEKAEEEHWWSWDWFSNIPSMSVPPQAHLDGFRAEDSEDSENSGSLDGIDGTGKALALNFSSGVAERGCLMQNRFDWLSEARKRDFERWKVDILARIVAKEQAQLG